jgi:hypothetical protein
MNHKHLSGFLSTERCLLFYHFLGNLVQCSRNNPPVKKVQTLTVKAFFPAALKVGSRE